MVIPFDERPEARQLCFLFVAVLLLSIGVAFGARSLPDARSTLKACRAERAAVEDAPAISRPALLDLALYPPSVPRGILRFTRNNAHDVTPSRAIFDALR
jgi:hypothetical protein